MCEYVVCVCVFHLTFLPQQLALEKMLNILKYLNNSMKVVGLKGFPGSLVDQGRLLIQVSTPPPPG